MGVLIEVWGYGTVWNGRQATITIFHKRPPLHPSPPPCQESVYPPSMTASEVLQFEAGLHLPTHLSAADRQRCCWEVLALVGLVKAAHTLVWNWGIMCYSQKGQAVLS